MNRLHAIRTGPISWDFRVHDDENELTHVQRSWVRNQGSFELAGNHYEISPEGFRGRYVLKDGEQVLAKADPKGPQGRNFRLLAEEHEYYLKPASVFGKQFVLLDKDREVGHVWPEGSLKRGARLELPDDLPLPDQVFLAFLVLMAWQQQEQKRSSTAR